jgi:hypothetical protein
MTHSDTVSPTTERAHGAEPSHLQVPTGEASSALEAEPRQAQAPASTRREVVRPAVPAYGLLPGEFAIRTYLTNNYLTARDGGRHSIDAVITAATTLGPNEKFKLTTIESTHTSIQTLPGNYVSAVGEGGLGGNFPASQVLQTERTSLALDALFVLGGPGENGRSTIGTFNGHFLTALGGGGKTSNAFHTDATVADTWEAFFVLKSGDLGSGYRYAIRPAGTGGPGEYVFFLAAFGGGGRGTKQYDNGAGGPAMTHYNGQFADSQFTLIRLVDGSYALQTPNGINYVTAVNGGGIANGDNLHTDATQIQAWEKFKIVDQGDATYTIQTVSGFYLAVNTNILQSTGGISTRISDPNAAPQIGYTAKFELMMIGA